MHSSRPALAYCLVIFSLIVTACQSKPPLPTAPPTQPHPTGNAPRTPGATQSAATPVNQATPAASATPEPPKTRSLVICLSDEPKSLYIYGGNSRSMWSVLEAIYDGPIDTRGYATQPVILTKIPSLAGGDAVFKPVTVQAGDAVIDSSGNLVTLAAGMSVQPSGCDSSSCAVKWDGKSELKMDELAVTFALKPGLLWSDGQPLTADDSVYSYSLSADPATPSSKYLVDRTYSYKALNDLSVEWVGLPGYFDPQFGSYFWLPLPKHLYGSKSAADLLADNTVAHQPTGWGPYMIKEWTAGDHITLVKNPHYFRAAEGLPHFDTLVYRFTGPQGDSTLQALRAGECDVVDENPDFYAVFPSLLDLEGRGKVKIYVGQGPEWEHLDFGIQSADTSRPSLFGDARTRQAVAQCIDRDALVNDLLFKRSVVPASFMPASSPLAAANLPSYAYNPEAARQLLDEVGWKDAGAGNPRVAQGVKDVPDGTPLVATYLTTSATLRVSTAQQVQKNLAVCGVKVNIQAVNPGDAFGPGPDGPVFGRKFDLAQFAWESTSRPDCLLYTSGQIPSEANRWIGANISGYSRAEYDTACAAAISARPGSATFQAAVDAPQKLFAQDLPAIPLYEQVKFALSRPDLCGFDLDVTARSLFWNIEGLDYAEGCPKK